MYKLKLIYFDIQGGRAEAARIAMHIGGIEFDDFRFPFDQFAVVKKTTPLQQVPTLFVDGKQITQCNSINRFVGKLTNLYPSDNLQALLCDEIMDAIEDITNKIVSTFGLKDEALKLAREALAQGPILKYLKWLQLKFEEQEGEFFIENRLTMADLKVFMWLRLLFSGNLEHISMAQFEHDVPKLIKFFQQIPLYPAIAEYYTKQAK